MGRVYTCRRGGGADRKESQAAHAGANKKENKNDYRFLFKKIGADNLKKRLFSNKIEFGIKNKNQILWIMVVQSLKIHLLINDYHDYYFVYLKI